MDDTPNTNFDNCPTSHADGQKVSYVKCMTWQMGQDGLNASKYGAVDNSFVKVLDDSLKPWDSHGMYKNITIWQQALGWPINFGWWNWNQPDVGTVIDSIHVIHNHNWLSSKGWPETKSGQCVGGGIYGTGPVKKGYKLSNIFSETAVSCAIGLEISKSAYNRHPTPEGCVGSIIDVQIDGMFFDEEFHKTGGYDNYLSGEPKPNSACTGDLAGKIQNMKLPGNVAGRDLARSDFIVDENTVPGLRFTKAVDPHPLPVYTRYADQAAYAGRGAGAEIDSNGVGVTSAEQCVARCHADWSCDCVVHQPSTSKCWKRKQCSAGKFVASTTRDVYVRPYKSADPATTTLVTTTLPLSTLPTAGDTQV